MRGIGIMALGCWEPQQVRNFHAVAPQRLLAAYGKAPQRLAEISAANPPVSLTALRLLPSGSK